MLERPPLATEQEEYESFQTAFETETQRINATYPYWDKVKYMNTSTNMPPKQLWFALKTLRQANRTILKFGNYKFSFTTTDEILELLHYFDMNIGGSLTDTKLIPADKKNTYLISSIMEEAIASSQMEGAAITRKVAKDILRKAEKPINKSQQMIVNNYQTINYIKEHYENDLSIEGLKEIHRSMTFATLGNDKDAGIMRTNNDILVQNGITGEVAHIPPPYDELGTLLQDLTSFFNKDGKTFIHPIIKAIIIHFMLAYFHPFSDGNGRTSRSLFYWYMMKQGYWLIEYMSISRIIARTKAAYEKAYLCTEYDDNDLTYFILYNLRTIKKAFDELKAYIKYKKQDNKSATILKSISGINERQAIIIQIFKNKPNTLLTVKEIENRLSVTDRTARTDLEGLVQLGYMQAIQVNKVKRNYAKSDKFDLLLEGIF